jgi:flagellar protein FliO/FliZ
MNRSLTLTRGVAMVGALTLTHAATALAAVSSSNPSTSSIKASAGENTPLNLGSGSSLPTHAASSGSGSSIVRTIVGLFIVIAVIYGVAWILRQAKKGKSRATGNGLSQLASLPLGNGRSVALVRAGTDVVLVGVSENSVTPIRTYTEDEVISCGIDVPEEEAPDPRPADKPTDRMLDLLRRITVRS